MYQASRGASYLYSSPASCLKENSLIILAAKAEEGCGWGLAEQRFFKTLSSVKDLDDYVKECVRKESFGDGQHRAYITARTLLSHQVIMVGTDCSGLVEKIHMTPAGNMKEAAAIAQERLKINGIMALVVPDALTTIPVLADN
ncbi:MAG: hypothetical protein ACE5GM_06615 [bacterium]